MRTVLYFLLVYAVLANIFSWIVETFPFIKQITEALAVYTGGDWVWIWVFPFIVTLALFLGSFHIGSDAGDSGFDFDGFGGDGGAAESNHLLDIWIKACFKIYQQIRGNCSPLGTSSILVVPNCVSRPTTPVLFSLTSPICMAPFPKG